MGVESRQGRNENSPALECWETTGNRQEVPPGTTENSLLSVVPDGTLQIKFIRFPALKCWAIFESPWRDKNKTAQFG